jgi:hypothetical protein
MFVELLEKLRCPNRHETASLVATASRTVDRHILDGVLGCPVCHAEFLVREGALELDASGAWSSADVASRDGGAFAAEPPAVPDDPSNQRTLRTGALLGLDGRAGIYVVDDFSARAIPGLAELSPNSLFIALSRGAHVEGAAGVIRGHRDVLPLAHGCARGIVLDEGTAALLLSAVDALAPGGRLVAPASAPVPEGITVLARDDDQWVGEREPAPTLSALRRAPR